MNLVFGRRARTRNGKGAKFLIKSDKAEDLPVGFSCAGHSKGKKCRRKVPGVAAVGEKYQLSVLEYKDDRPGVLCCSTQTQKIFSRSTSETCYQPVTKLKITPTVACEMVPRNYRELAAQV